jgi:hypothetical protein
MSQKPTPPFAFQPAPRPQARLSADDAARLSEATADLGFARPVSAEAQTPAAPPPKAAPAAPRPAAKARPAPATKPAVGQQTMTALKIEAPESVWTSLKLEAVRRRVTVRFLILEALARQGYEIDLAHVPQDGRRLR